MVVAGRPGRWSELPSLRSCVCRLGKHLGSGGNNLEMAPGEGPLMAATPCALDLSLKLRYSLAGGLDASGAAALHGLPTFSVVER